MHPMQKRTRRTFLKAINVRHIRVRGFDTSHT
jgi:hypothetical protein